MNTNIRVGPVVRILVSHADGPGSNPGRGIFTHINFQ